ncbi:MAG: hypothetical protein ACFB4I_15995 [Cyanophyceae cyanobacterium]
MFYKKMAFGLLAAVAIVTPATAQVEQGQGSIQKIDSSNAAVNGSVAASDIYLNSEQTQNGEGGYFDSQGQTSIQDVDSRNAAVNDSVAVSDIDLNSRQEQWQHPSFYGYDSQGQTSMQGVSSGNAAVNGSIGVSDLDLNNQQYQLGY